jgi:hypothetical protein
MAPDLPGRRLRRCRLHDCAAQGGVRAANLLIAILIAVFRMLKWLPWWIAAMRAAFLNDDGKAERGTQGGGGNQAQSAQDRERARLTSHG